MATVNTAEHENDDQRTGVSCRIHAEDPRYPTLIIEGDFGIRGFNINPNTGDLQKTCICAAHSASECICGYDHEMDAEDPPGRSAEPYGCCCGECDLRSLTEHTSPAFRKYMGQRGGNLQVDAAYTARIVFDDGFTVGGSDGELFISDEWPSRIGAVADLEKQVLLDLENTGEIAD